AGALCWEETFRSGRWQLIFPGLELRRQLAASGASWEEAWQAFRERYPGLEHLDAAGLGPRLAPRPLLLMTGSDDPLVPPSAAEQVLAAARPRYRALGAEERVAVWIAPGMAHAFPKGMQEQALSWLQRWL
ncbi:MAG: hypothetical protein AB1505_25940, partial [Candidatus Latescibacterota bacterium]